MSGINWPEVFAGFAVGLTPLAARQTYIVVTYIKLPSRRKFLGHFWTYRRSSAATGRVVEDAIQVSYSLFLGSLSVRTVAIPGDPTTNTRLTYIGRISGREGMVRYVSLRDPASHERLQWYVIDPFQDPFEETEGLYMGLDLRGLPVTGPILLSRRRLSLDYVETRLENHVLKIEPRQE